MYKHTLFVVVVLQQSYNFNGCFLTVIKSKILSLLAVIKNRGQSQSKKKKERKTYKINSLGIIIPTPT